MGWEVQLQLGFAEQVPLVSREVNEDRKTTVGLCAWLCHELNTGSHHSVVCRFEILDSEKEPYPSSDLVSYCFGLVRAISTSEQNAGPRARRTHNDPSLWTSIVGERRRVLYQLESERIDEEIDRRGVVVHHDGDKL